MLPIHFCASLFVWSYREDRWWVILIWLFIFAIAIYYQIMDRAELPTSFRDLGKWILVAFGLFVLMYATWWIANYRH